MHVWYVKWKYKIMKIGIFFNPKMDGNDSIPLDSMVLVKEGDFIFILLVKHVWYLLFGDRILFLCMFSI